MSGRIQFQVAKRLTAEPLYVLFFLFFALRINEDVSRRNGTLAAFEILLYPSLSKEIVQPEIHLYKAFQSS